MGLVEITAPNNGVMVVAMNDPRRYNAVSMSMVTDLRAAFAEVGAARECRCVVLIGNGRGFCAGADLSFESDPAPDTDGRGEVGVWYKTQQHLADLVVAVHELRKPVVAAIHGAAVGGGLGLSLACDLRIGALSALFSARFIRIGLTACDVGTSYLLPRIVGAGRAAELMLTGRDFGAEEAERIGLLSRITCDADLLQEATSIAEQIAAHTEFGSWMTKVGLQTNLDAPSLRHAVELENRTQVLGLLTGNMIEGGTAMMERRTPQWRPL